MKAVDAKIKAGTESKTNINKLKKDYSRLQTRKNSIANHNQTMTKKNFPIVKFVTKVLDKMKDRIKQVEQINRSMLENFIEECIVSRSQGKNIELKAKEINTALQLGFNTNIVRKKLFFQKSATTLSVSDQLLKLIGEQYPDIVQKIMIRWQNPNLRTNDLKKSDASPLSSRATTALDVESVLIKAGVSHEAFDSFNKMYANQTSK